MPGTVLHAAKPGLFGLNMVQLIAGMMGFYVGSSALDNVLFSIACALAGMVLGFRSRGLYMGQLLFYRVWGMAMSGVSPEGTLIDPAVYYQAPPSRGGQTYIVTNPDGQTYTLNT